MTIDVDHPTDLDHHPALPAMTPLVESVEPAAVIAADDTGRLAELAALISSTQQTPEVGVKASVAMAECFESAAREMERIGNEAVERAAALREEIASYTSVLRQSGAVLCNRIEAEAARVRHVAIVARQMRELLKDPDPGETPN